MAELGQETVDFSTLVSRAADESYLSLKELVEKSKGTDISDSEKKIAILKYVVNTQQRMLRLNVLAKWCQQVPLIQYCQQLVSTLSSHDTCFSQTADSLFFMHEGLQQARAPIYDVPSAVEILLTGEYHRLPKCIEDVGMQNTMNAHQQKAALKKLDTLVRSKLLEVSLPKEISQIKISDGTAVIRVEGEFKVLVTLGYRGHLSLWRILHLELLVGERTGPVKLEEMRRHALGDDLERRMAASENPFITLYSVLHELSVALVMDTVIRQVQTLRQGRWKDAIRFELISDGSVGQGGSVVGTSSTSQDGETDGAGLKTPGVKILYWLDSDKSSSSVEAISNPFIKIEPGPDLQIKCLHSSFVIDPLTGKEAEFFLDQNCIDVEKLLLRAICCNRYTRLLEIFKDMEKKSHIFQAPGDVRLETLIGKEDMSHEKEFDSRKYEGQEVLFVRAYGSSFFTLGINIRNGRFLLQASKNIVTQSELSECEDALNQRSMTAAKAFISLREKSILHLFARTGRFLGLEIYEHGAVKLPKNISDGSSTLLMGFPDCGGSYYMLMQLDNNFKPLFKLLETQRDPSGKAETFSDLNNVIRMKNVDIGQMMMFEDDINLSLLDCKKVSSVLSSAKQTSERSTHSESNSEGSSHVSSFQSKFASIVDEVFELEKGSLVPSFSSQGPPSTYGTSPISQFGSGALNIHSSNAQTSSPKWDGGLQSQHNSLNRVSGLPPNYGGRLLPSGSTGSILAGPGRSQVKKMSASKSDQDLASLRSPMGVVTFPVVDEYQPATSGIQPIRHLSSSPQTGLHASAATGRSAGPTYSPVNVTSRNHTVAGFNSLMASPVSQSLDSIHMSSNIDSGPKQEKVSRKRSLADLLSRLPSLQNAVENSGSYKRRRILDLKSQQPSSQVLVASEFSRKTEEHSYADVVAEANKGNLPSSIYVSALLHVVRHCSLCIKHARLTSQMDALDIPYVEEVGLRTASSNLWFRLPFARGDTWQHICLRLGRPGSMYWDVKICDQHFTDLWELQKGSSNTPWGSGVRIANTSDLDAHIRYDAEGVVLSYHSVEADSIKKLIADIERLSNARTFALGMRKLLGVRADEKIEENTQTSDVKTLGGTKTVTETADKSSEQLKRAFKIEAVGLMSLWFSFGSGVLARFVVEWESSKDGCTMHVSPDQLWPHTKFLEDFINGAEVASLLDCIRLTAGPLQALAAATRPARAAPVSGVTAAISTMSRQTGYVPSQANLPSITLANASQVPSGPAGGNTSGSGPSGPLGSQNHHTGAMLAAAAAAAAAGRGGTGIVPSSLLPIDVSVVLRGPYWIRIIYRKNFAVDMRCFAGDQVWLQPATPPKGGPSIGGSLPCPQFRPFIMEHVAQELNGLDSSFPGGPPAVTLANAINSTPGTGALLSASNGNRTNLLYPAGISRSINGVAGLGRIGNGLPLGSNLSAVNSGLPIRRSPGTGVPAHVRGELNTAIIGLGDDGGYGGGWVPLAALKKVLRGILKYLGVLWLFAQLPELLKEILGSILKDNEGSLLNLDQEQPALRFFVGGYVFAVSVHRVQLLLQVISVTRFHHSQRQQNSAANHDELTQSEISEICDYFSRRVASEPYDASRVASFITLLTLPVSVLREFLKLIAWKKGLAQSPAGDLAPAQKSRIELCLENHGGLTMDGKSENSSVSKSNIQYDRAHNAVDFGLTVVLDPSQIPHINAAGGAAWLPYCVSVRLRYSFGDSPIVSFLGMEGSHGGHACWIRLDDWETCKQRVIRTVEMNASSAGDANQGRLRAVAESVQRTLHASLQSLREESGIAGIIGAA